MLYRPSKGKLWDPTVLRWQGRYYLFTMYYEPGASESYACRLAVSEDGVHWQDRGNVLTDACPVWKCGVFRASDGRFYMNYGTTSVPGVNDGMGYAVSDDLLHWEKTGCDAPDPRWYEPHERWDHMYCRESDRGGYVGCIVAVPKAGENGLCGLRRSPDGKTWETCPPPRIDWNGCEPAREMEVGGFEKIGGRWYLMGGICPPYNGNYGYAAYTFEADAEDGTFRPCRKHRFSGQNGVPGTIFVSCLPGFVHNYDDPDAPLLASGAVCYELDDPQNTCWATPLCRVLCEPDGLFPGWWDGNDVLRGEELPCPASLELESRALPAYQLTDEYAENELLSFDPAQGLFLEGVLTAEPYPSRGAVRAGVWRPSAVGFAIGGTAILSEAGSQRCSYTRIGGWNGTRFEPTDTVSPWDAACAYLEPGARTGFRLLVKHGVAQLYLDNKLCQTFTCAQYPKTLSLLVKNARARAEQLRAYRLNA